MIKKLKSNKGSAALEMFKIIAMFLLVCSTYYILTNKHNLTSEKKDIQLSQDAKKSTVKNERSYIKNDYIILGYSDSNWLIGLYKIEDATEVVKKGDFVNVIYEDGSTDSINFKGVRRVKIINCSSNDEIWSEYNY